MVLKTLTVTINEDGKPEFATNGSFTTMEFFGIARLLESMAQQQENAKLAEKLFEPEGDQELAMAESDGRSDSHFGH
jgi:hypothetical protein